MLRFKTGGYYPLLLLIAILFTSVFIGCQKDEFDSTLQSNDSQEEVYADTRIDKDNIDSEVFEDHRLIQIGTKKENPYTVESMQKAFDYYNLHVKKSTFKDKQVAASHYYIKILPTTEEHLEMMDELDNAQLEDPIVLHDYPLDHNITTEGDYLVDPTDENDLYHTIYTVIPVGYSLPPGLPYETIDEVYQPTEEEYDVETASMVLSGWEKEILEDFDEKITIEKLPAHLIASSQQKIFGKRYRPHGWVQVENNQTNVMDPLMHAKISIGRGIWWRYTYTDANGHFTSPKKYRGKVRIRAKWRSNSATIRRTWNELLGIQVSDHLMTITRGSNGRTKNILRGSEHLWYKGTVHNGIARYNVFAVTNNITPVSNANVWVWINGGGNAVAPMLFQYRQLPLLASLAGVTQGNFWSVLVGGLISIVPSWLRPDLFFNGLNSRTINGAVNTGAIQQVVFHESSHFSHAKKAGANYWAKIFSAELRNSIVEDDPYHDGVSPTAAAGENIGLAEGWGTYMEFQLMEEYYERVDIGGNWELNPVTYMEDFNMYTKPMTLEREENASWFLSGVMWDLSDNIVDTNTALRDGTNDDFQNDIVDLASGFGAGDIFSRLKSNVKSLCDLRDEFPNNGQINDLFESYGCDEPRGGNCFIFSLLFKSDLFGTKNAKSLLSVPFGLYDLRDNFMSKSAKGNQYIKDFYRMGELVKSGEVEISAATAKSAIDFVITHKSKINTLNESSNKSTEVLISKSEAKQYSEFVSSLKSKSNNDEWVSILTKLEKDIELYKGATISKIKESLK